jgi:F-type H+-transporting ATPase subunit delta
LGRFRAVPYARALDQVVRSQCPERAEAVVAELERVAAALAQVPELERVLVTPMVDPATKGAILDQVLDALAVTEPARALVHVVQRHYRMANMAQIASHFRELVDRSLGRTRARVEVARALAAAPRRKLLGVLERMVGGAVVAEFVERPELLAGFRIQVGSKVFDGSVAGQLERLAQAVALE